MLDGVGVKLIWMLGYQGLMQFDFFLMLDYFSFDNVNDYIVGFLEYLYWGFEMVIIMIEGKMCYGDNKGYFGVIEDGGFQWMIVGCGIVYFEIFE